MKAKEDALNKFWDTEMKVPVWKAQVNYKVDDDRMERRKDYRPNIDMPDYHMLYTDEGKENCDFDEIAKFVVDKDCSTRIAGLAGTGKTTFARKVMAELDKRGLQYQCLAPTNKAARLLHKEAMTLHKFFNSFKDAKATGFLAENKYYIIDEVSMVGSGFYRVLLYLSRRLPDSRFIVIGDMAQLAVVGDIANFNYENSVCLWEICGGNLIELVQCRRADKELFTLSKAAAEGDDISEWVDKMPGKHYPKSVAFTNRSRIKVNNYWMKKLRPKRSHESIFIPRVAKMKKSEDLWVYEGLPVIAIVTRPDEENATKIANTDEYEVLSFNKDRRRIRLALKDNDGQVTNEVIKVSFDKFARLFRAAYCTTIHSTQGCTIKDTHYTIYDYDHPRFDKRLKYVALSRASNIRFINIDRREYKSKWARKDLEELVEEAMPNEEEEEGESDEPVEEVDNADKTIETGLTKLEAPETKSLRPGKAGVKPGRYKTGRKANKTSTGLVKLKRFKTESMRPGKVAMERGHFKVKNEA
jgi:hypothetical protein